MTTTLRLRATVGRWAELPGNHPLVPRLKERFTIPNPEYEEAERLGFSTRGIAKSLELWQPTGAGWFQFPRGIADEYKASSQLDFVDETVPGELAPMTSLATLRPEQVPFVETMVDALQKQLGAVGRADPGWGKTVASLAIVARLGVKTLILVHKEFLMTQWVERILGTEAAAKRLKLTTGLSKDPMPPFLNVRPEEVGLVQQETCEWRGRKIVVAMAQSLASRTYEHAFYESFGLVVTDEVHRFAAPTFCQAIVQFPAAKRLGVTATPNRKDGLETVFFAHIGRIAAVGKAAGLTPRVNILKTPVILTDDMKERLKSRDREDMVKLVSFLVEHEARNDQIVRLIMRAVEKPDRKVLILSDRRAHLDTLRQMLLEQVRRKADARPVSTAYYVGGMSLEERKEAEKMQVLFATYAMAAEGLDIPTLDTLFLVTPRRDVVQTVGRILRRHADKRVPVVVDFVDVHSGLARALARKREEEYRRLGWMETNA